VRLEELGKLKKFNDLIGNRTRNLTACSIVPQQMTLQRAPIYVRTCVLFRTVSQIQLFHCTLYRRATRHVLTRVAKCIDVDGGIFKKCIILGKLYQLCHLKNKYRY
jgi:hypothetical protein